MGSQATHKGVGYGVVDSPSRLNEAFLSLPGTQPTRPGFLTDIRICPLAFSTIRLALIITNRSYKASSHSS